MINVIEELTINALPAYQTYLYDGWVLRICSGFSNRMNSIYPLYNSEIDLNIKIDYCQNIYNIFGLGTIFRITSSKELSILDKKLDDLGYSKVDETSVRILNIEDIDIIDTTNTEVTYELSHDWINSYTKSKGIKGVEKVTLQTLFNNIAGKSIWAIHKENDKNVGYGIGIIDKGYIGISNIYIEEAFRGKGYGKEVMNKLLIEAKKLGAKIAYLSVSIDNTVAISLYNKLGFKEVYRYWYKVL